jgi:hypothetical protein
MTSPDPRPVFIQGMADTMVRRIRRTTFTAAGEPRVVDEPDVPYLNMHAYHRSVTPSG